MAQITHYWDVINLSNPPGVTWLLSDGSTVYGHAERGELPVEKKSVPAPVVIHGVNPRDTSEPMDFGAWRPVSDWLSQSAS